MQYQLVLQFEMGDSVEDFRDMAALEDLLRKNLLPNSELDGHDSGSGVFNIFIWTEKPRETFEIAQKVIPRYRLQKLLRAVYRELDSEEFLILWPESAEGVEPL